MRAFRRASVCVCVRAGGKVERKKERDLSTVITQLLRSMKPGSSSTDSLTGSHGPEVTQT